MHTTQTFGETKMTNKLYAIAFAIVTFIPVAFATLTQAAHIVG